VIISSWNLNSRTNPKTLQQQADYLLSQNIDIITLQEVVEKSDIFFKSYFKDWHIASSFDYVEDKSILVRNRKYGQLIVSRYPLEVDNPYKTNIPFPERVLTAYIKDLDLRIMTTHIPPGSSNGVIKVEHYEGLYNFLEKTKDIRTILTGDFNSPQGETADGEVITWGQRKNSQGKLVYRINPKWKDDCDAKRWDEAERSIIQNHTNCNLKDAFRSHKGYQDNSASWFTRQKVGRRYDHIFIPTDMTINEVGYEGKVVELGLSDHLPIKLIIDS